VHLEDVRGDLYAEAVTSTQILIDQDFHVDLIPAAVVDWCLSTTQIYQGFRSCMLRNYSNSALRTPILGTCQCGEVSEKDPVEAAGQIIASIAALYPAGLT
jgi:hypothetical protein